MGALRRFFSHSRMRVILTQDCLPLGVAGDVVAVRPGFAQNTLLPQGLAVAHFPLRMQRLFPDLDPAIGEAKKRAFAAQRLLASLRSKQFAFVFEPSRLSASIIKPRLGLPQLLQLVNDQTGLQLVAEQCRCGDNLSLFGPKRLAVQDYTFAGTTLTASFELQLLFKSAHPPLSNEGR